MEENATNHKRYALSNRKERRNMDDVQKHWEKERETHKNAINRETRELATQLRKLLAEKDESKESLRLVRDLVHQMEIEERARGRSDKRRKHSLDKMVKHSKLHPTAKLDPSNSLPPNSHDVAVHMLASKQGQKRKQSRQPPAGMPARPAYSESISPVISHAGVKLPHINKNFRHSLTSVDPPQKPSVSPHVQLQQRAYSVSGIFPQPGHSKSSLRKSSMRLVKGFGSQTEDGDTEQLDMEALEHYYRLIAEGEQHIKESDASFKSLHEYGPSASLNRSQHRKVLAMEALLKSLPSLKKRAESDIRPLDALSCRYLRLTKSNIEDLEMACREEGIDPGIHSYMTTDQCQSYYDDARKSQKEMEAEDEMEIEYFTK